MKTKIFVMTHKKFQQPKDKELYIPLHVGRKLGKNLGYMGDDTGDSISNRNPLYGELTGMYWLWKNYTDTDYIGICHYRRYFFFFFLKLMTKKGYEEVLKNADILVSNAVYAPVTYIEYYGEAHNADNMIYAGNVIHRLFPQYEDSFIQVVMKGKKYYFGNLCVMSKKLYDEYCEWLFAIFFEMEKNIDVSGYDEYHKRVFGFLSEQLLFVFITANKLRVAEGHIGVTAEKAETVEFKLAMKYLVKEKKFTEARELFYAYIKLRPDVQLELSDIKGEIPDIELILYILEQENDKNLIGFYQVSNDLFQLINHLRKIRIILRNLNDNGCLKSEEINYLQKTKVSDIAKHVIMASIEKR